MLGDATGVVPMKAKAKKLVRANAVSLAVQVGVLGVLWVVGLDTWLAVGISKGASWGCFAAQMLLSH